ncbi:hypothetical protein EPK99_25025 [Neorhizobium lilium]|uniref:Helix-turn-helix domain-containing protein n=1 Tax=Neorhizobium lilium TaxID=2503024 RepID=A0A3S3RFP5_9HYPH|nr:helix-turn-helix domain-containing protein [Neorhizobium lilium]RWX74450.1 hypothetical protein EPK99_25025 [Neorhizobium lilium]
MTAELSEKEVQSFTSWKLDILDAISCDPSLQDVDARVAFRLMQHINARTRDANPSIERLAAQLGCHRDTVRRSLDRMSDPTGSCLWLFRQRGSRTETYRYSFIADRWSSVIDGKIDREDRAREASNERRLSRLEVAPKQPREMAAVQSRDVAALQSYEVAGVQPKHLPENYLKITPSDSCSDDGEILHSYSSDQISDESNMPLPKPGSAIEADAMIDAICEGLPVNTSTRDLLLRFLNKGILTPNMAINLTAPAKEARGEAA